MSSNFSGSGFARCFILFMSIVILIQGVIYCGLAVWGLIHKSHCPGQDVTLASDPFQYVFNLIYFANEECGDIVIDDRNIITADMDWSKSQVITSRFNIFLWIYAVISALWIFLSLLVMATICCVTKITVGICFWPWFLSVLAGSIFDIVTTVFFVLDIMNTTDAQKAFDYIGLSLDNEELIEYFNKFDQYLVTPAIVLTCLSCRVVVIWFLNILGAGFCLSLSNILSKRSTRPPVTIEPRGNTNEAFSREEITEQPTLAKESALRLVINSPPPPNEYSTTPEYATTPYVAVINTSPNQSPANKGVIVAGDTTYRSTEAHPDKLDYPASEGRPTSQPQRVATPDVRMATPELSLDTPLNNRYSESFNYPQQNNRVSDELRSQLPWSYTSSIKPQQLRKTQIYPDIPEADYDSNQNNTTNNNQNNDQAYSRW